MRSASSGSTPEETAQGYPPNVRVRNGFLDTIDPEEEAERRRLQRSSSEPSISSSTISSSLSTAEGVAVGSEQKREGRVDSKEAENSDKQEGQFSSLVLEAFAAIEDGLSRL